MDTSKIWESIYANIKGWHLIVLGVILVGFGLLSIFKIENSHSYSLKLIIGGLPLLIVGVAFYIFKK